MISEIMTFMKSQIFAQELFTPFDITSWTNGAGCCCCFVTHQTDQPKLKILTTFSTLWATINYKEPKQKPFDVDWSAHSTRKVSSISHESRRNVEHVVENSKSHCVYYLIPLISFMFFFMLLLESPRQRRHTLLSCVIWSRAGGGEITKAANSSTEKRSFAIPATPSFKL